jgi:hypothetical protein
MRSIVCATTIAVLLSFGQSTSQPFAGSWTSDYFGRTLARLELQDVNGSVTGRMSIGYFHVDSDGKLDVVIEEATVFTPILDVVLRDGVLSFAKVNDGTTDRYELRVSGDTATLSFLLTEKAIAGAKAAGMGAPQPIVFRKTGRTPVPAR